MDNWPQTFQSVRDTLQNSTAFPEPRSPTAFPSALGLGLGPAAPLGSPGHPDKPMFPDSRRDDYTSSASGGRDSPAQFSNRSTSPRGGGGDYNYNGRSLMNHQNKHAYERDERDYFRPAYHDYNTMERPRDSLRTPYGRDATDERDWDYARHDYKESGRARDLDEDEYSRKRGSVRGDADYSRYQDYGYERERKSSSEPRQSRQSERRYDISDETVGSDEEWNQRMSSSRPFTQRYPDRRPQHHQLEDDDLLPRRPLHQKLQDEKGRSPHYRSPQTPLTHRTRRTSEGWSSPPNDDFDDFRNDENDSRRRQEEYPSHGRSLSRHRVPSPDHLKEEIIRDRTRSPETIRTRSHRSRSTDRVAGSRGRDRQSRSPDLSRPPDLSRQREKSITRAGSKSLERRRDFDYETSRAHRHLNDSPPSRHFDDYHSDWTRRGLRANGRVSGSVDNESDSIDRTEARRTRRLYDARDVDSPEASPTMEPVRRAYLPEGISESESSDGEPYVRGREMRREPNARSDLKVSIPTSPHPRQRSTTRERGTPQSTHYVVDLSKGRDRQVSFSPSTDGPIGPLDDDETPMSIGPSSTSYARRIADATLMKQQSEARHQILREVRQAMEMRDLTTEESDKFFWERQIATLNASLQSLCTSQDRLPPETGSERMHLQPQLDRRIEYNAGGVGGPSSSSPSMAFTTMKIRAPSDLPSGHKFTIRINGKAITAQVPNGGVQKGDVFSIRLPFDATEEEPPYRVPPATVKIRAPASLPEGYRFTAKMGDRTIIATVPPGGVKKGEIFAVPIIDHK